MRSPPPVVLATTATVRGGVWRHIEDLALALRDNHRAVHVALVPEASELRRRAEGHGLPTIEFTRSLSWRRAVWHGHLHDTYDRAFVAAALTRRVIGPVVLTEHLPRSNASDPTLQPGPRHPLAGPAKTAFKRVQLGCADAVIAVSESSAAFLRRRYRLRHDRITVVANGIEAAEVPVADPGTVAVPDRPVRVLSTGALIHQKGHDLLLAAAARSHGEWQAEVLGDGPLRQQLARVAAAQGLPVSFPGWSDDVPAALARAQIVCLPSRWEAAPYAALEAMSAGLPLVAADVDGLRDVVEPGVTGLLVPPESPEALATALGRLAVDAELRATMGAAARTRVTRLTVTAMASLTESVYAAAAAHRGWRRRPAPAKGTGVSPGSSRRR